MAQYRYVGPGPDVEPGSGAVIHPGDVWEHPGPPAFGLWEPLGTESSEKPSEALEPATPANTQANAENPPTDASGSSSTPEA